MCCSGSGQAHLAVHAVLGAQGSARGRESGTQLGAGALRRTSSRVPAVLGERVWAAPAVTMLHDTRGAGHASLRKASQLWENCARFFK